MMNPVYWLELRIRAQEKRLWIVAAFFVASLVIISGVVLSSSLLQGAWRHVEPASVGNGLVWAALFCQAGLLVIMAPLATAGRISQEREQRTLPALINSTLPASRIALGKLMGSWVFVVWLGLLVIPFVFTASLWGGPSFSVLVVCIVLNLLAGFCLATVSLGLSGGFGRSLTAYLVTGAFLFGWIVIVPLLGTLGMALYHDGGSLYQEVIAYLTFYHHPFFPLITLTQSNWAVDARETLPRLAYALVVWGVIAAAHFALAVKGLKREVY